VASADKVGHDTRRSLSARVEELGYGHAQRLRQPVEKYRAQPWFRHIKKSASDDSDKFFATLTPARAKPQTVAICSAYAKTSVGDVRVSVYARTTTTKPTTKVDGSKSTTSKTADDLRARSKVHVSFSGPDYLKEGDVFESLFGD
jgi:hypothetical protein